MERYFNIRYEFDRELIHSYIAEQLQSDDAGYICVADGNILQMVYTNPDYRKIVDGALFSICDSSYVPLYLKWLYGIKREQYCGSEIFMDIIRSKKYRMIFMGTSQHILDGLKNNLMNVDPRIQDMTFLELPFCRVEDFDYKQIADVINKNKAEIIWVALGAPKQEYFMSNLKPYLTGGVMIAVGAAFKFFSGVDSRRAPLWMVKMHLEFVYRIFCEPKKQLKRCMWIIYTLPGLFYQEWKKKSI